MWNEDVSYTLSTGQDQTMFVEEETGYVVRRLTPTECERLQGFPDGWTDITGSDPDELLSRMPQGGDPKVVQKVGKWCAETPDTPRYKAMGNSMAVTVMRLLGKRIEAFDTLHYDEIGVDL